MVFQVFNLLANSKAAIEIDLNYEGIATILISTLTVATNDLNRNRPELRRDCDSRSCPAGVLRSTFHRNRPELRRDCDQKTHNFFQQILSIEIDLNYEGIATAEYVRTIT